ncbi:MAG: hypothetical protein NW223_00080 [Hyphomicrobiaceae bacterium]|nr:hypothetical protein [Hyphomicrobiaceae bacterium]
MFGGRRGKSPGQGHPVAPDWHRLPEAEQAATRQIRHQLPPSFAGTRPPPIPPPRPSAAAGATQIEIRRAAEEELLAKITGFRSAVADALYEVSNDYRILCNLAHADLRSCGDLMNELRGRLAEDTHYRVLAKLDEAHALTSAALGRKKA